MVSKTGDTVLCVWNVLVLYGIGNFLGIECFQTQTDHLWDIKLIELLWTPCPLSARSALRASTQSLDPRSRNLGDMWSVLHFTLNIGSTKKPILYDGLIYQYNGY